ncbi:MAG TPA: hypothetical protein VJA66_00800 [Thermoanaerobaculia bacterium]
MQRTVAGRIVLLLMMSMLAFYFFSRSAGAESVRAVQVLLLFAAGVCFGVALTLFRVSRSL